MEHNFSLDANNTLWFLLECTLELDSNSRRIFLFLFYLLVFMAGLLENLLVIWVNWRRRNSSNGVLFCIINVTLSDLMVMAVLPFFMMEVTIGKVWLWGHFLCKFTNMVYVVNYYSSSLFLACMTLERYLSLTRPSASLFPLLSRQRWLVCGGLWTFSLVLALMENVHVDLLDWDDEPGCYMLPENNFVEWYTSVTILSFVFQFFVPAAVIVTCNVLISRAARSAPDVRGRRDVWLVHVYSLVFVVCWLPYNGVMLLMMVDDLNPHLLSCNAVDGLYFSLSVVHGISFAHCVANPLLYNFLSKSFRNNLVNTVVSNIPRDGAGTLAKTANADDPEKPRRNSNTSTSQSDVAS